MCLGQGCFLRNPTVEHGDGNVMVLCSFAALGSGHEDNLKMSDHQSETKVDFRKLTTERRRKITYGLLWNAQAKVMKCLCFSRYCKAH